MNDEEFGSLNPLKLKYSSGDHIIQTFYKISSPQKFGLPFLICGNFKNLKKVLLNMQNALKCNEWRRIWVVHIFELEIQQWGRNNSDFLQNLLPQKLVSPYLIWRNFKTLRKLLLNHEKCMEPLSMMTGIWVLQSFII